MATTPRKGPKAGGPRARKGGAGPRRRAGGAKAAATVSVAPDTTDAPEATATAVLRKKELMDKVAESSGVKRADAKSAVEAALQILGAALSEGREMNLEGFGKVKVTRTVDQAKGTVFVCRIRRPKEGAAAPGGGTTQNAPEGLAEDEEDS